MEPGTQCTIKDAGASGWITVQGKGKINGLEIQTPVSIRFGEEPDDELFITYDAANKGLTIENNGSEPLVSLRYFGPDTHASVPNAGDARK